MHVTKQVKAYDNKEGKDQASIQSTCADPESFVRGGPLATFFFYYFERGERIQIPSTAFLSSKTLLDHSINGGYITVRTL